MCALKRRFSCILNKHRVARPLRFHVPRMFRTLRNARRLQRARYLSSDRQNVTVRPRLFLTVEFRLCRDDDVDLPHAASRSSECPEFRWANKLVVAAKQTSQTPIIIGRETDGGTARSDFGSSRRMCTAAMLHVRDLCATSRARGPRESAVLRTRSRIAQSFSRSCCRCIQKDTGRLVAIRSHTCSSDRSGGKAPGSSTPALRIHRRSRANVTSERNVRRRSLQFRARNLRVRR